MATGNKLLITVLALATSAALISSLSTLGSATRLFPLLPEVFRRIETHLNKNVESGDIDENMSYLMKWRSSLKDSCARTFCESKLVDALDALITLNDITVHETCDQEAYNLLEKIDKTFHWIVADKKNANWRVERMVQVYSQRHAAMCRDFYLKRFKELQAKEAGSIPSPLNHLLEKYIPNTNVVGFDLFEFSTGVSSSRLSTDIEGLLETFKQLEGSDPGTKLVKDTLAGKSKIQSKNVERLVKQYFVKPCQTYVNQYQSLFLPAERDYRVIYLFMPNYRNSGPEAKEFFHGYATFKICKQLGKHSLDKIVEPLTNRLNRIGEMSSLVGKLGQQ